MNTLSEWSAQVRGTLTAALQAFFRFGHNGFALMGLALVFCTIALVAQPDLRHALERRVTALLQARQYDLLGMEIRPDAVERVTALDPRELPKPQAAVAYWISERYRVAPEPIAALVSEAFQIGQRTRVEPTLLLAIMAIESGFNPFAQSPMGAQGLMQVMTKVHTDKYENFGGNHAAFDPVTNLRVGARVLKDCVQRAGSLEGGLKQYVGAAISGNDGGYVIKVMAEFNRLQQVAAGKSVPALTTQQVAVISIPPSVAAAMQEDKPMSSSTMGGVSVAMVPRAVAMGDNRASIGALGNGEKLASIKADYLR